MKEIDDRRLLKEHLYFKQEVFKTIQENDMSTCWPEFLSFLLQMEWSR